MSLTEALLKVQRAIEKVEKDGKNEHIRAGYPTLEGILDVLNPHLNENEIVVNQMPFNASGIWVLRTTIRHGSESDSFDIPLYGIEESKNKMQALGSAITYARRYGLISYFKLSTTKAGSDITQAVNIQAEKVGQVKAAAERVAKANSGRIGVTKLVEEMNKPEVKNHAPQTTAGHKLTKGKYTGKTIGEIGLKEAENYLSWVLNQGENKGELAKSVFAQELHKAIEEYKRVEKVQTQSPPG